MSIEGDFQLLDRVTSRVHTAPAPAAAEPAASEARDWSFPGIFGSTRVATTFGDVPAHLIRKHDRLRTKDGKFLEVLRISEYKLDDEFLSHHPEARPVVIRRGSLAPGKPACDIHFSPGQRIVATGPSGRTVLATAIEISSNKQVVPNVPGALSYFVFHLAEAALVRCEGIWVSMGE